MGRTGICGRGLLGRFGPNHAADPVVTRWKRDAITGEHVKLNGRNVLEFIAVRRKDTGQWALPGGMVEPGDTVSDTLKKEFGEEALNLLEKTPAEVQQIKAKVDDFFRGGVEVYSGYVVDPRNTDNAWMETVAVNFHDEDGVLDSVELEAGDDAAAVRWIAITPQLHLYASHKHIIDLVRKLRNAA